MNSRQAPSEEQAALWNGDSGRAWVDVQPVLDRLFKPFENRLVDAVRARRARSVLDVGCGTGATTLAIARLLGTSGRCLGVDISEPMLFLARARADLEQVPATFVLADAESYAFEPGSCDMIVSRFGIMFFADAVRAFTNLRRAARAGAALCLVAWRSPAENPFMTTAESAAAPLFPNMPPRRPDGPGQFAWADRARVEAILEQSGWATIDVQRIDVPLVLAEKDLDLYITRLGPLGRMLAEVDEPVRAGVLAKVRRAFDRYLHGDEVRFDAACWMISAQSSVA